MDVVLDSSAALALCMKEYPPETLATLTKRLVYAEVIVPSLWLFEVANGLSVAVRRGRLQPEELNHIYTQILALDVHIATDDSIGDIAALVDTFQRTGLSPYDAAYLGLALQQGASLASFDQALNKAAAAAGVPLVI